MIPSIISRITIAARRAKRLVAVRRHLRDLAAIHHPTTISLGRAVELAYREEHGESASAFARIERERVAYLQRSELLVDGTLGPGGPYDQGHSISDICRASRTPASAAFLHLLVRELAPTSGVELGTNVGISAAYQAAAGIGTLYTLEASPYRLREAKRLHERLGLHNVHHRNGLFGDILPNVLDEVGTLDYAFVDGHHQYQPTLDYFEALWGHTAEGAIIVFDDIRWSEGMKRAWADLQRDPRVVLAANYFTVGLCLTTRAPGAARRLPDPAPVYIA